MSKTLTEVLIEAMTAKRGLALKISQQMKDDVANGVLSKPTVQQNALALDNIDAALLNLEKGELENAVHFFARACSNLGEFKGRSDKERNLS